MNNRGRNLLDAFLSSAKTANSADSAGGVPQLDSSSNNEFRGWKLLEALERTTPTYLWQQYLDARDALFRSRAVIQTNSVTIKTGPRFIQEARDAVKRSLARTVNLLQENLRAGLILARGISKSGEQLELTPEDCANVATRDWRNFTLRLGDSDITVNNVRFSPFIYGPKIEKRLAGKTLAETFRLCILEDPEFIALHTGLDDSGKEILDWGFPRSYMEKSWRLQMSDRIIDLSFVKFPYLGIQWPDYAAVQKRRVAVIGDRWRTLISYLASGKLRAVGDFEPTGEPHELRSNQWARQSIFANVEENELTHVDGNVLWSSIRIATTESLIHSGQGRSEKAKSPYPSPTTLAEARIHDALVSIWPNGVPANYPPKSRNTKIFEWLKDKGLPLVHEKTVRRYLKKQ